MGLNVREPCFLEIIRRTVRPGWTVFDIGANDGSETQYMVSLNDGMGGVVHAFEPLPVPRRAVGGVQWHQMAVSDRCGMIPFYPAAHDHLSGIFPSRWTGGATSVRSTTVDAWPALPNFVKMDIEGGEVPVLRGGHATWALARPCAILFETHPATYTDDNDMRTEMEYLLSVGFVFRYMVSATVRRPPQFDGLEPVWEPAKTNRALYENVPVERAMDILCDNKSVMCPIKNKRGKSVRACMVEKV